MSASSHLKFWKLYSTFIWLYQLHTFVQMSTVEYDKVLLYRANKWMSKGHDCVTLIQNNRGKGKLYPPSPKHWLQLQSTSVSHGEAVVDVKPRRPTDKPTRTWPGAASVTVTAPSRPLTRVTQRGVYLFSSSLMWCDWVLIIATRMSLFYQSDASNRDVNTDMWHWTNRPLAPRTG